MSFFLFTRPLNSRSHAQKSSLTHDLTIPAAETKHKRLFPDKKGRDYPMEMSGPVGDSRKHYSTRGYDPILVGNCFSPSRTLRKVDVTPP